MRINQLKVQFTEYIPDKLQDGTLYISMEYATASHNCACGCGKEVVTPFTPTDWKLTYDGESVSLSPSIGNWSYPCRAHYFIQHNRIVWAANMSQEAIAAGRRIDMARKKRQYSKNDPTVVKPNSTASRSQDTNAVSKFDKFLAVLARLLGFK